MIHIFQYSSILKVNLGHPLGSECAFLSHKSQVLNNIWQRYLLNISYATLANAGICQGESSSTKGGLVSGSPLGASAALHSQTPQTFSNSFKTYMKNLQFIENFKGNFENL